MKRRIQKLAKAHFRIEQQMDREIQTLERYGKECNCNECETMDLVHEGNSKELQTFCINCGGYVEQV